MTMSRWVRRAAALLAIPLGSSVLAAQGVTTSAITGIVRDATGVPRENARVVAIHEPSATTYEARTRADGRFTIPGMRVGGPYRVTTTLIGFEPAVEQNVFLTLGVATELRFNMEAAAVRLEEVTITGESETVFSSERTGAATSVGRDAIETLPTITARIEDFVRLTPQFSGSGFGFSFAGQDNRMNNITVDGSYFNNSFGLAGQPGDRTGVAPISMDAIEQVQVNIAPYDVRQGNFIGAGVNTVTRSGTNEYRGSVYYAWRDNRQSLHGRNAGGAPVDPGQFDFSKLGLSIGGPILRDKLFFFVNYEDDGLTSPGSTFRACRATDAAGTCGSGGVTRVAETDLNTLSTYLSTNFGYVTGPYQGYDHETPATRFLTRLDYNLNTRNKFSLRYNQLESFTDVLLSNSTSLGNGNRRTNTDALNFQNSNYQILENINSMAAEWNAVVGSNMSNNLLVAYSKHDESRNSRGQFFPLVDIREGAATYTSFGFEPFTPNNELRYNSTQLQNNFSIYRDRHELTFGVSAEKYESENVFFQGAQSVYVYNSLADFYTDADDFIATCGANSANWSTCSRATSPVTLNKFEVAWNNIQGMEKPLQPLEVFYAGIYAQDQWRMNDKVRLTFGLRLDRPSFGNTAFVNTQVDAMDFRNADGATVKYSTSKLPDANVLFSPRFGFNWDVEGDRTFQVRGGTGVFTGRPAYVWISNQVGNNGILTGFERVTSTTTRPFHPDPNHYKPATIADPPVPASSYALAFTDPDFKFPQLWRTNLAADKRLPWDLVGTAEFLYSKDVNGLKYINANLPGAQTAFTGPDTRPRWTANRINANISNAIVLENGAEGYAWNFATSLEKPFGLGTFVKAAYSYGVARSLVDPGSIASGSWSSNQHFSDPNNPALGYAATSPGHRLFAAASKRMDIFRIGSTTAALFWERRTIGNASFTYSGDLNGDGSNSNDLLYVPRDVSEMNFEQYTSGGRTYTVAEQEAAWEAFIRQDEHLSSRRGQYAERGAVFLPMFSRADFSVSQQVSGNFLRNRNTLEIRADFLNFGNLLNHNWGVSQRMNTTQPLEARGADGTGAALHRFRAVRSGGDLIAPQTFVRTAGVGDVYRIQLQVRYNFN